MAGDPNPAARAANPVALHPYRGWSWTDNPTAGNPNVTSSGPSPITGSPNIAGSRRYCLSFDSNRRRRLGHKNFARSRPCGSHFSRYGCRRSHRWWWCLFAADQCKRRQGQDVNAHFHILPPLLMIRLALTARFVQIAFADFPSSNLAQSMAKTGF